MQYVSNLVGPGEGLVKKLKIGATIASGVIVMKDATFKGEAIPITTSSATDAFGVAQSGGTYSTATEAFAVVVVNPMQVIKARCSGSATTGAALSTSNLVLTQTSASTTVITSTSPAVIASPGDGGLLIAMDGANAGLSRVQTSHVDATSYTATVAFPNSVAVGDHILYLPFSAGSVNLCPTSDFLEVNAYIAAATGGIDTAIVEVEIETPLNPTNPTANVKFTLGDAMFNPID